MSKKLIPFFKVFQNFIIFLNLKFFGKESYVCQSEFRLYVCHKSLTRLRVLIFFLFNLCMPFFNVLKNSFMYASLNFVFMYSIFSEKNRPVYVQDF